ncbi:MAG: ABC transporter ATP-binding protein [bacterium]
MICSSDIWGKGVIVIHLEDLKKTYGDTVAVADLSLKISSGEVFGLLGPNGAGKTTTVSMAAGLLRPDSGRVDIGGKGSPENPEVRRLIGIAPQAIALYDELTAEENLFFFGRLQQLHGTYLKNRVEESLDFVGLIDRKRDRAGIFSGGMKRRLNLAAALIHQPKVVFMDEPTAGVDPQSRNALFDNVTLLKNSGVTILYTTHYMEEAQKLCDRVAIVDHGRLIALGTVNELIAAHGGKSVVIAEREDRQFRIETNDPVGELVRLQNGGNLQRFSVESPTLENVFLTLTGRSLRD